MKLCTLSDFSVWWGTLWFPLSQWPARSGWGNGGRRGTQKSDPQVRGIVICASWQPINRWQKCSTTSSLAVVLLVWIFLHFYTSLLKVVFGTWIFQCIARINRDPVFNASLTQFLCSYIAVKLDVAGIGPCIFHVGLLWVVFSMKSNSQ